MKKLLACLFLSVTLILSGCAETPSKTESGQSAADIGKVWGNNSSAVASFSSSAQEPAPEPVPQEPAEPEPAPQEPEVTKKTCVICNGSGVCTHCDGNGLCNVCSGSGMYISAAAVIPCANCSGEGKCQACRGNGACKYCDGNGYTTETTGNTGNTGTGDTTNNDPTPAPSVGGGVNICFGCNGTGMCNICHGSNICQSCHGTGGKSVAAYGTGGRDWVDCTACHGSRQCKYCTGGKCRTCGGSGKRY